MGSAFPLRVSPCSHLLLAQVGESKLLIKSFIAYCRHNASNGVMGDKQVELLFMMLSIVSEHTLINYTFLKDAQGVRKPWDGASVHGAGRDDLRKVVVYAEVSIHQQNTLILHHTTAAVHPLANNLIEHNRLHTQRVLRARPMYVRLSSAAST